MMTFEHVPRRELESGKYTRETMTTLLAQAQREYKAYVRTSAVRNLPVQVGSYLALCLGLAGYALGHEESIWVFSSFYLALSYIWVPMGIMLPLHWLWRRPSESSVKEDLDLYRELWRSGGELYA